MTTRTWILVFTLGCLGMACEAASKAESPVSMDTEDDFGEFLGQEDDFWSDASTLDNGADPADLPGQDQSPPPPQDLPMEDTGVQDDSIEADIQQESFTRPDMSAGDDMAFPDLADFVTVSGQTDCLEWELKIQDTNLTFKADRIFVLYRVVNTCNQPVRLRTRHESDFLPVGIQRNGQPWVFLPDCPGTGPETAYTLDPTEGWQRGWFWDPADHEARLARCGVTFDEEAQYQVIGYGLTAISSGYSELFPMTEPIPINLQR